MITFNEIRETNRMIEQQKFDVRTITMGINLMDCADSSIQRFNQKIYDKITRAASKLVETGDQVGRQYGIPIVNKRISVTPIAIAAAGSHAGCYVSTAMALERAAQETGVNFIGGFSALVQKGCTLSDSTLINSLPEALSITERVCASVNLGTSRNGINMDSVKTMGHIIKEMSERSGSHNSIACAKLVVFCNAVEDNPFMAGAFHGVGEKDIVINVGVSGPGVVKMAVADAKEEDFENLCEVIKKTAFKITRVGQLVANETARKLGVPLGIVDLSLAPTPSVGDSVAEILQEMGLEYPGAPGTTAAVAILNDSVKKGGIMASAGVGGLSGAFIPVSEDRGMIDAVLKGALTIEKLEALTCVCSVGIDMVAIPGSTSSATISGIIADEMAIGMINNKTTAVRVIPVHGKEAGEMVEFGGLLGYAPIMSVNSFSCERFINRGGRIPAPIHSFKN